MVIFDGGWSESGRLAFPVGSSVRLDETGVLATIAAPAPGRGTSLTAEIPCS
jgi:hypothetical protein